MDAILLEWRDGRPLLRVAQASVRRGLVTVVSCEAGAAAVAGWIGSLRDRERETRRILDAFLRTGVPAHLPTGDFAAVLVSRDRIALLRDEQARVPLYFAEAGGQVSRAATSLRRLGGGAEADRRYLCRYLTGNTAQPHWASTPFAGVRRVLGGEVVELSADGWTRNRSRRHTSGIHRSGAGPDTRLSAARRLRTALDHAVERRLGQITACHVSGGTDSTSLGLLAARQLAARPDYGDLVLLTGVFGHGDLAGERTYADQACTAISRLAPTARPVVVEAGDVADFDDFAHHAGDTDEPCTHAFRAPLWSRLHSAAAEHGCDALLTGCGADPVADANPLYLHRLARTGRLRRMLDEARILAASSDRSVRETLFQYVVRPSAPLVADRAGALARRRGTVLGGLGDFGRPRWLRAGFARAYGYRDADRAASRFVFGPRPEESRYEAANHLAAPDPLSWSRACRDGFLPSHPFLDPEVVTVMRGLPPEVVFAPGRPKALLRQAMADLLPPDIRERTVKVSFNQLYARGLYRHGAALTELCRSARHPLIAEIFDVEVLCRAVREASLGVGNAFAWDRLNASLALVAWLERADRRGVPDGTALRAVWPPDQGQSPRNGREGT